MKWVWSLVFCLTAQMAFAQFVVDDMRANALATAKAIEDAVRFKQQMEYLIEQARTLSDFDWNYVGNIERHLRTVDDLLRRTSRIADDYGRLTARFSSPNQKGFSQKHEEWEKQAWKSMRNAFEAHGAVDSSKSAIKPHEIAAIVRKTKQVKGNNEALQLISAAMGVQLSILQELKTIITADSQARLADAAAKKVAQEEKKALQQKADKDFVRNLDAPLGPRKRINRLPRLGEGLS